MLKGPIQSNFAYITLITNDEYLDGVALLAESLRKVDSQYPLYCMYTNNVSQATIGNLASLGVFPLEVPIISLSDKLMQYNLGINAQSAIGWRDCLTKFNVFKMTNFDKVIFCDADLMFLKNCDHCFELPHMTAAVDGEYSNVWPTWVHFNSGFVVIKPSIDLFDTLIDFAANLDPKDCVYGQEKMKLVTADQEILNLYYANWPNRPELHLSKYYNIFPRHVSTLYEDDIKNNAYFVHFVGTKPWHLTNVGNLVGDSDTLISAMLLHTSSFGNTSLLLEYYEVGLAIIQLSKSAHYHALNWQQILANGEFYAVVADTGINYFKDLKTSQQYIQQALVIAPNKQINLQIRQLISLHVKAKKVAPVLRELFTLMNFDTNNDPLRYNQVMMLLYPLFNVDKIDTSIVPYATDSVKMICAIYDTITKLIYNNYLVYNKIYEE